MGKKNILWDLTQTTNHRAWKMVSFYKILILMIKECDLTEKFSIEKKNNKKINIIFFSFSQTLSHSFSCSHIHSLSLAFTYMPPSLSLWHTECNNFSLYPKDFNDMESWFCWNKKYKFNQMEFGEWMCFWY